MGDHDYSASCLSSRPHDIRDIYLHYFGCLKVNERDAYLKTLPEHKQERITREEERIRDLRAIFEVEDDTKALVYRLKNSLNAYLKRPVATASATQQPTKPTKDNAFGMSAYAIFFRDSVGYNEPLCSDQFPNQKISIDKLIHNKEPSTNPLMQSCEKNEIRYFHIPGNNMEWMEEAIARHFHEERPPYDGLFRRPENPSKTYMLLRPEYWRAQQHGGRHSAVHARHMRPRCDIISTDSENLEDSPKNLVLFMPYLHWETDRRRAKFDETMRNITEIHLAKAAKAGRPNPTTPPVSARPNGANNSPTAGDTNGATTDNSQLPCGNTVTNFRIISTTTEAMEEKFKSEIETRPKSKFSRSNVSKRLVPGVVAPSRLLGQVLFRAAQLSEAMEYYQEKELLKTYLHHDPPLHPRRTLDQSYYWTLKTTKRRDRDQVVYRGTAPNKEFPHSGVHCKVGCEHCRDDIRKVPRIIMVDQLWLWILDGNTIITSFPKRYGRNKPDPSSVHKSIRMRLKFCRKNEIRSAYDLALVIVDECCRVFFDRTKTPDRQPQVMDLFASAIGNVNNKQTIAYDHFWQTTQKASDVYKAKDMIDDAEDKAKSLLDINPEGNMLREIKDILDELHIMTNIKNKQQRVFKQFLKHIKHMIAPSLALSKEVGTARPKKVKASYSDTETADDTSDPEYTEKQAKHEAADRDAKWTLESGLDFSNGLNDRLSDLSNLKESAENTEKALDALLGLKQQQASVVQARKAVQQTEETLRQGRAIMLFTVITIIFLPLSFGASFFGMNTKEYGSGPWTLKHEAIFMFPISLAVILPSFILAFSSFTRSVLALLFDLAWIYFVTGTRLYNLWVRFKTDSHKITNYRKRKAREWKETARKEEQKRREDKDKEREKKKAIEEAEAEAAKTRRAPVGHDNV